LSGRGLCDELITRPEESYRLCCVVVCDLETSRIGAPYTYDISRLRVKGAENVFVLFAYRRIRKKNTSSKTGTRAVNINHALQVFNIKKVKFTVQQAMKAQMGSRR